MGQKWLCWARSTWRTGCEVRRAGADDLLGGNGLAGSCSPVGGLYFFRNESARAHLGSPIPLVIQVGVERDAAEAAPAWSPDERYIFRV